MDRRFDRLRFVLRAAGSLLGGGFLVYQIVSALRNFRWSSVSQDVVGAAAVALLLAVAATLLQMTAWKVLVDGLGFSVPLDGVFTGFSLSFVARYIPGTVWGYLARGEWLKRDYNVPFAVTNLGSLVETLGIVVANLFIVIQGMLLDRSVFLSSLLALAFLVGSWAAMNLSIRLHPVRRAFHLEENGVLHFALGRWILVVALYAGMWSSYGLGLTILSHAFSPAVRLGDFFTVSAVYAAAWFIGFIVPFLPSGLGLREYSLTLFITASFAMAKPEAAVIAIGFRLLVSLAEVLWVLFGLFRRAATRFNRLQTRK
jgi:hypothetical protein